MPNEDAEVKKTVEKLLAEQSKPYKEIQEDRQEMSGKMRIGTTFNLRPDFYSAMWLYSFKADYVLGTKFADKMENLNRPDIEMNVIPSPSVS